MRILRKLIIGLLVLSLLAAGSAYLAVRWALTPAPDAYPVEFTVPSGMNPRQISRLLEEKGIVRSGEVFYRYLTWKGEGTGLQAGTYSIGDPVSAGELIELLKQGRVRPDTVRVTIPEGYRVQDILPLLADSGLGELEAYERISREEDFGYGFLAEIPAGQVHNPLEGFLFPDTYEFFVDVSEREVLDRLLGQFDRVFDESFRERARERGLTIPEVVTMASIVEKEARLDSERPVIAGVFYNRLAIGMALQSCATVQFLFETPRERLLYVDLEIDSPYNTYLYPGLPPGPIASPGKRSLEAALWPDDHGYYYFVARDDGSHIFSRTHAEHQEARNAR